ncbi:DUF4232 domain-containing protein [Streptomyces fuscigenes]|uniref:DUF4232 domain-containing protein n=1 Tax=Streptomyces fuscigenes TaxID=1528880 RepID=UPI001F2B2E5F|nr:DUF4232 domain-containing protein [Streptomyces fuscigenes]MCF3962646.1 DUF4232 domain-containing protein [Streptomyces fuscigenes]
MSRIHFRNHLAVAAGSAFAIALTVAGATSASAAPHAVKAPARATAKAAAIAPCTGANTKVTAAAVSRPINHLLLTAKNTGKTTCAAYYAPALRFDAAQSATQVDRDSIPQSVVVLKPGQSAYASVTLSGDRTKAQAHGHTAKSLEVWFMPRNEDEGSVGTAAHPALPKNTYTDDDAQVSYWQSTAADALIW